MNGTTDFDKLCHRIFDADQMALDESEAYMSAQAQAKDDFTWRINAAVHMKILMLIADTPTVDAKAAH